MSIEITMYISINRFRRPSQCHNCCLATVKDEQLKKTHQEQINCHFSFIKHRLYSIFYNNIITITKFSLNRKKRIIISKNYKKKKNLRNIKKGTTRSLKHKFYLRVDETKKGINNSSNQHSK